MLPNASATGPSVTVAVLRPSEVSVSRVAATAMAPEGAADRIVIGPAEPEPPPARVAAMETVCAIIALPRVTNCPAVIEPDEGNQRTVPLDCITPLFDGSVACIARGDALRDGALRLNARDADAFRELARVA